MILEWGEIPFERLNYPHYCFGRKTNIRPRSILGMYRRENWKLKSPWKLLVWLSIMCAKYTNKKGSNSIILYLIVNFSCRQPHWMMKPLSTKNCQKNCYLGKLKRNYGIPGLYVCDGVDVWRDYLETMKGRKKTR